MTVFRPQNGVCPPREIRPDLLRAVHRLRASLAVDVTAMVRNLASLVVLSTVASAQAAWFWQREKVAERKAEEVEDALRPGEIKEAFHEPFIVMEELKLLQKKGHGEAVGLIVDGTSKIALGKAATDSSINGLAARFATAMRGETFFGIDDTQRAENQRFRKAMFVAACASLAAEAKARAVKDGHDEADARLAHVEEMRSFSLYE